MKSSDFFRVQSNRIYFMQSGRDYSINVMKRTEMLIRPVLKKAGATVANAVANAMTNSIANGNEQVLIRGNLDYYEMVEHARRLQKKLKQYLA